MFEVEVGKLFLKNFAFNNDYRNVLELNEEDFGLIGTKLIKNYKLFISFMNDLDISLEGASYKNTDSEIFKSLYILGNEMLSDYISKNMNDEKILGKLIWKQISQYNDGYLSITDSDLEDIYDNTHLIWQNIPQNLREIAKHQLVERYKSPLYHISSSVLDSMFKATDKVLLDVLGYYSPMDGLLCKCSEIGDMVWNMFVIYNPRFKEVVDIVKDDGNYYTIMDKLGKLIISLEDEKVYNAYMELTSLLCQFGLGDFGDWTHNHLEDGKEFISGELYDSMMECFDLIMEEEFDHLFAYNKDSSKWERIDSRKSKEVEVSSNAINLNFDSKLTIDKYFESNGNQFFCIGCNLLHKSGDGTIKLVNQLHCMYNPSMKTYAMIESLNDFVGLDPNELERKIILLCEEYKKTL